MEAEERLTDGPARDLVHREPEARPVERSADPPLLAEHDLARLVDEPPHPLEVPLAPQRLAGLALRRDDPVEDVLGRDRGVIEAGQEERRPAEHPGVPDHQVLDRGPLGVAEVERAGDVRGRLDDRERLRVRVGLGPGAVGREDVGRQPALVDRALEVGRPIGLRQLASWSSYRSCRSSVSAPVNQRARSSSGRTGSWYHLLVRRRGRAAHRGRPVPAPSRRAIGRQPSRLAGDVHAAGPARLAPSRARSVAVEALLLPVLAVRPGV